MAPEKPAEGGWTRKTRFEKCLEHGCAGSQPFPGATEPKSGEISVWRDFENAGESAVEVEGRYTGGARRVSQRYPSGCRGSEERRSIAVWWLSRDQMHVASFLAGCRRG